jgi:predicted transglutaminase-like protease
VTAYRQEGDMKMKKLELIESVIEMATNGEGLNKVGETCKYKKDCLDNKELHALFNNKYANYEVSHDNNYEYIRITRK